MTRDAEQFENPYAPPRTDSWQHHANRTTVSWQSRWIAMIDLGVTAIIAAVAVWLIVTSLMIFLPPVTPPPPGHIDSFDRGMWRTRALIIAGISALYFSGIVMFGILGNMPRARNRADGAFWLIARAILALPLFGLVTIAIVLGSRFDVSDAIILTIVIAFAVWWMVQLAFIFADGRAISMRQSKQLNEESLP